MQALNALDPCVSRVLFWGFGCRCRHQCSHFCITSGQPSQPGAYSSSAGRFAGSKAVPKQNALSVLPTAIDHKSLLQNGRLQLATALAAEAGTAAAAASTIRIGGNATNATASTTQNAQASQACCLPCTWLYCSLATRHGA